MGGGQAGVLGSSVSGRSTAKGRGALKWRVVLVRAPDGSRGFCTISGHCWGKDLCLNASQEISPLFT